MARQDRYKDIAYSDLCDLIAIEMGGKTTKKSVDNYLKAIYKVVLQQLELNKRIYFQGFGYFYIKEREGSYKEIGNLNNNNEKQLFYIKPKNIIKFKPSERFNYCVNENNFKYTRKGFVPYNKTIKEKQQEKRDEKELDIADIINLANSRKDTNGETNVCQE